MTSDTSFKIILNVTRYLKLSTALKCYGAPLCLRNLTEFTGMITALLIFNLEADQDFQLDQRKSICISRYAYYELFSIAE